MLLFKGDNREEDTKDDTKQTPLSWAAGRGHDGTVKILLDCGADTNARDKVQRTPLLWAAHNGHSRILEGLLDAGARIDAMDKYGQNALLKAKRQHHEECVALLERRGSNPHIKIQKKRV